jgi:hypothetical protein
MTWRAPSARPERKEAENASKEAENASGMGQPNVARHVIVIVIVIVIITDSHSEPSCVESYMASYDVASISARPLLHVPATSSTRVLNPRVLSYMASYDVASIIWRAMTRRALPTRLRV